MNTISAKDDTVPAFAQRGTSSRHVDVIAPGVHVLGLRVPNSYVDQNNPAGRVGTRFIRGSGTSQATAVASGVAALIAQKYPTATPDQIKYLLARAATKSDATKDLWQGLGTVDADKVTQDLSIAGIPAQVYATATGQGTLEDARGSSHVVSNGATLAGEVDIFGRAWRPASWATAVAASSAWVGGTFNGSGYTGSTWARSTGWAATTWTTNWAGGAWSSRTWVTRTWVGNSWDSRTWVDSSWSSRTWVGAGWSSRTWVDQTWASASWT
jgi:serine protease AprX